MLRPAEDCSASRARAGPNESFRGIIHTFWSALKTPMKRGTPRHPKVMALMKALNLKPKDRPLALGYLELLWHFAAEFAPRGDIGRYENSTIEAALDWYGRPGRLVQALTTARWVEVRENTTQGRVLVVHDWHDHADDSVRKRLERAKQSFLSLEGKVTGICPEDGRQNETSSDFGSLPKPIAISHKPPPLRDNVSRDTDTGAHEKNAHEKNGNGRRRRQYPELPKAKAKIVSVGFADVGDPFMHRLYIASCEAARHGGCDPALITDELLAKVIEQATKNHQESAGLYLETVPAIIKTWAETEEKS